MSTPKYFNARDWGAILTRDQVQYLWELTQKVQSVDENATAVNTADDIEQGDYNRFYTLANQTVTRNTDGTVATVTHATIQDNTTFLVQTFSYNSLGQISGCVSVDSSTSPSKTITETFTYTGDAITSIAVTVA